MTGSQHSRGSRRPLEEQTQNPDAALIALGAEYQRLHAEHAPVLDRFNYITRIDTALCFSDLRLRISDADRKNALVPLGSVTYWTDGVLEETRARSTGKDRYWQERLRLLDEIMAEQASTRAMFRAEASADDVEKREEDLFSRLSAVGEEILRYPAQTLDGIRVKAMFWTYNVTTTAELADWKNDDDSKVPDFDKVILGSILADILGAEMLPQTTSEGA